jgi:hypothetical protein
VYPFVDGLGASVVLGTVASVEGGSVANVVAGTVAAGVVTAGVVAAGVVAAGVVATVAVGVGPGAVGAAVLGPAVVGIVIDEGAGELGAGKAFGGVVVAGVGAAGLTDAGTTVDGAGTTDWAVGTTGVFGFAVGCEVAAIVVAVAGAEVTFAEGAAVEGFAAGVPGLRTGAFAAPLFFVAAVCFDLATDLPCSSLRSASDVGCFAFAFEAFTAFFVTTFAVFFLTVTETLRFDVAAPASKVGNVTKHRTPKVTAAIERRLFFAGGNDTPRHRRTECKDARQIC